MNHRPLNPEVLEILYDDGYGGWITNLFSVSGRAENAQKSADKARAKGKDKKADRLESKAASRQAKADAKQPINATFANSPKLWVVRHPYSFRGKSGGSGGSKTISRMAKGARPKASLYDLERRATIVGGLQILAAAWNPETNSMGYAPFNTFDFTNLRVRTNVRKDDQPIINAARKAAAAQGITKAKRPNSLKSAAKYVREQVAERGLSSAAWSQRAVLMVIAAQGKAGTTAAVLASTLAITGAVVGTILTAGAASPGLVATIASVSTGIASGGAQAVGLIKTTKLGGEWARYELEVANALKRREQRIQNKQLDRMTAVTEVLDEELAVAAQERMKAIGRVVGPAVWIGAVMIGASVLARTRK